MTVRMRWKGEDFYDEEFEDEDELMVGKDKEKTGEEWEGSTEEKEKRKQFNHHHNCELIWMGMPVTRAFHLFMFQTAQHLVLVNKISEAKGVAHYWDLYVGYVEMKDGVIGGSFGLGDVGDGTLRFWLGDGSSGAGDDGNNKMMEWFYLHRNNITSEKH